MGHTVSKSLSTVALHQLIENKSYVKIEELEAVEPEEPGSPKLVDNWFPAIGT